MEKCFGSPHRLTIGSADRSSPLLGGEFPVDPINPNFFRDSQPPICETSINLNRP